MEDTTTITKISEPNANKQRMAEIRFDCLVRLYDSTVYEKNAVSKPAQWIMAEQRLTLEAIKFETPESLGHILKAMLQQLENSIEKYNNHVLP